MKWDVDDIRECEESFQEFREYVREFCYQQDISKAGMKSSMGVCENTADNILCGVEFKKLHTDTIKRIIAYMKKKENKAPSL